MYNWIGCPLILILSVLTIEIAWKKLRNSCFMVGEIGGNDYNYTIFQGKSMDELGSIVSDVVNAIMERVKFWNYFPIGCLPIYQTAFYTNVSTAYDDNQCLKQLNDFATYHNERLQQAIHKLQKEILNAVIIYGDYYNAYQFLNNFAHFMDWIRIWIVVGSSEANTIST